MTILAAFGSTAAADAATTFGQTGVGEGCASGIQEIDSRAAAPSAGLVTMLQYKTTSAFAGASVDLQVLRPVSGAVRRVVGIVRVTSPGAGNEPRYPASIVARQGDVLGMYIRQGPFPCTIGRRDGNISGEPQVGDLVRGGGGGSDEQTRINLRATLTPFLDSFSSERSVGKVFTSDVLPTGHAFYVVVQGTYSTFGASLMAPDGERQPWWAVCGEPEDEPLLASPGTTNARPGADPEFLFAFPQPGRRCSAKNQLALPKRQSALRFDTGDGAGFVAPTAIDPYGEPNRDHAYTYVVQGTGQALRIKVAGTNYRDNSGQFGVAVYPTQGLEFPDAP